jgi:hypothetical protein
MCSKLASIVAVVLAFIGNSSIRAGVVFLGPTPYLSAADSPFDLSSKFYLEDFEDGALNTPGVSGRMSFYRGFPFVDSVDADDGAIDGFGNAGGSVRALDGICTNTIPPICSTSVLFEFSDDAFGQLPNAVGLAWTDGLPSDTFTLAVYGRDGLLVDAAIYSGLGDERGTDDDGLTGEDRFFGAIYGPGIGYVFIRQRGLDGYFEFDHLQYGVAVPEPSSQCLLGISLIAGRVAVMMRAER